MLKNGDHVSGLARVDERADGGVDQLVLMAVEMAFHQQITHAIPGVVVQQQPTQHARFGLDGVRGHAQLGNFTVHRGRETLILQRGKYSRHEVSPGRPDSSHATLVARRRHLGTSLWVIRGLPVGNHVQKA